MTFREYKLRMKAYRLSHLDDEYMIALQAWMNREIQANKKSGKNYKPVFNTFKKFFDYAAKEKKILTGESESEEMQDMKTRYRAYLKKKQREADE